MWGQPVMTWMSYSNFDPINKSFLDFYVNTLQCWSCTILKKNPESGDTRRVEMGCLRQTKETEGATISTSTWKGFPWRPLFL